MDTYYSIEALSAGVFKDKGSKFLAFAFPVKSESEIAEYVNNLKKKYYDARHHCFAWRLGADMSQYRINDDGEPGGSAGLPILNQIKSKNLTNILIIVVRYFGGTLLGVSGLIHAYKQASEDALNNSTIVEHTLNEVVKVELPYSSINQIMKIIKDDKLQLIQKTIENQCIFEISVRKSLINMVKAKLEKVSGLNII